MSESPDIYSVSVHFLINEQALIRKLITLTNGESKTNGTAVVVVLWNIKMKEIRYEGRVHRRVGAGAGWRNLTGLSFCLKNPEIMLYYKLYK